MPVTHEYPKALGTEDVAWATIVNSQGLNADMLATTAHTDTAWVWTFDPTLAEGGV